MLLKIFLTITPLLGAVPTGASPDFFADNSFSSPDISLSGTEIVATGIRLHIDPDKWVQTTKDDFEHWEEKKNVVATDSGDVSLETSTGDWIRVTNTKSGAYGEAVIGTRENIYIAKGTYFYRYTPAGNGWTELAPPPKPDRSSFKTGTALAWDGKNYIYAMFGAAGKDARRWFYRYNISNDSWEALENTPADQGEGDALVWVDPDDHIYATIGGEQRWTHFAKYDPLENSWTDEVSDPPAGMGDGASLVWAGDVYLYALRGEFYEKDPVYDFWRYDLVDDRWGELEPIPAHPHDGGAGGVGDGASLLYVGSWLSNQVDFIYALSGNQAYPEYPKPIPDNRFYRYTLSANSWERLADLPFGIGDYVGNRLAYADGHIYVWQGSPSSWTGGGDEFFRYEFPTYQKSGYFISAVFDAQKDSAWQQISWSASEPRSTSIRIWTRSSRDNISWSNWIEHKNGDDLPGKNRYLQYRAQLSTTDDRVTPLLHELIAHYVPRTPRVGTFKSQTLELGCVENWGTISWNADLPDNTSITFATRSSRDGLTWSDWQEVSENKIESPTQSMRYLQLKATFAGNGILTPTLRSYRIDYVPDRSPPEVILIAPEENFTTTSSHIQLQGMMRDSNPSILMLDENVICETTGNFSAQIELKVGPNTIRLVALDEGGNSRQLELHGTRILQGQDVKGIKIIKHVEMSKFAWIASILSGAIALFLWKKISLKPGS